MNGIKKSDLEVPKEAFNEKENPNLLAQYVRVYLSNQRTGTASTKTRSEVKGSTRKIYKQKGTGRARHGDIKAPVFVGGGITGGPKPRNYSLKMNKKQIRKALYIAFSQQFKNKNIVALADEFLGMQAKTKLIADFLKKMQFDRLSILILVAKGGRNNFTLALRNLPLVIVKDIMSVNAYEILQCKKIFIIESALPVLEKHFLKHEN
ncbi:50S ribosomal protein L4 [Candidatus Roizmanbacteria bacterium RIFCSPHIGHO2_01_FULL_39_8]|uniref:Large ribosomal subunit protein uL4 n=3 Tax=Candidatus Roizmaniibacteriota TaxID=1752723 RepID=A0A1F7GNR3_9BACT|nr:MAG: 50S ribosomal protein L4 [Candidatus Roizmanbacteria bacterium RIFCSPHIGHO2_01_FULL_39_8]OGK28171.1 MAG: 50S ribosomal protein L4 [Candidatus Roizmanbacteria bacterium RIFCSPHIGHO2_02_FULL_39_9]OGK37577.1 MAG: 50S ribosomal protein L4 [Candidatus Roizmanbacteria bacterium RIFCSPHIGHO2_12_FULL_39_8]